MKKIFYFSLLGAFLCASCVSKKQFTISENGRLAAVDRSNQLARMLDTCQNTGSRQALQLSGLLQETSNLRDSLGRMQSSLYSNQNEQQRLNQLLNQSGSEQEKLNALLRQRMDELNKREQTIKELQSVINEQKTKVQALLDNVKNALLGFKSDELSVVEKDGKIYVAMSDKLLFKSGSATLDDRGKEALAKLAEVLNTQTDIDVLIEGHTDSKPINTVQFKDNWDLSVIRATSVVRILVTDYKVNPLQVLPAGRGQYMPVATNDTPEGRSLNRRTEIIMSPRIDKLYKMLQQ